MARHRGTFETQRDAAKRSRGSAGDINAGFFSCYIQVRFEQEETEATQEAVAQENRRSGGGGCSGGPGGSRIFGLAD